MVDHKTVSKGIKSREKEGEREKRGKKDYKLVITNQHCCFSARRSGDTVSQLRKTNRVDTARQRLTATEWQRRRKTTGNPLSSESAEKIPTHRKTQSGRSMGTERGEGQKKIDFASEHLRSFYGPS